MRGSRVDPRASSMDFTPLDGNKDREEGARTWRTAVSYTQSWLFLDVTLFFEHF